ncbi:MAG TPA: class II aldolase/adducin family protein [Mobilitalea sp.]|nr:class II aldolase/adducin family protein [Mobilitalea sp.]
MDVNMAKQLVVRAGKELVKSGLIARTWGNVSCRIDDKTFAVTPSGRSYETLQPEEIVICRVEDAAYEGEIKPSSEKGIHALVYRTYPDIHFVIHTHQPMASVISAAEMDSIPAGDYPLLGTKVPIAVYGLPGTKKLKSNIGKSLTDKRNHAIIMAHHGALCFGKDYEETFAAAQQLEEACRDYLLKMYINSSKAVEYDEKAYYNHYITRITGQKSNHSFKPISLYSSRRTPEGFILQGETEVKYNFNDTMPPEAVIHRVIYLKRKDVNYICQDIRYGLLEISIANTALRPLLDDFAQIVGGSAECAKSAASADIIKALRQKQGILVPGGGALCMAATESDLHAVQLVMEKAALAQIGTNLLGGGRNISFLDCQLMHIVYTRSYAKKANQASVSH